jgi:TetR/AcrR family transcriptional regulator, repressor for uid operon
MPKLKPDTQRARREHILEAAELCFARAGFHRTTMQDICKEAAVSPGALYVYFDSKEALIAGICERDRAEFAENFAALAAAPDFLGSLAMLGEEYFVNQPAHKRLMCVEIGLESTRNPRVAEIFQRIDSFINESFLKLFQQLKDEGRIAPALDIPALTRAFTVICDGMFWQRAIDPTFDPKAVMPTVLQLIAGLLNPVLPPDEKNGETRELRRD